MRNLTFVLALLALGAATFAFLVARDAAHAARDRGDVDAAFEQRIAALEQSNRERKQDAPPGPVAPPTLGGVAAGGTPPATAGSPELAGGARPVSAVELERRLAELEKRVPTPPAGVAAGESAVAFDALGGATTWVGSLDDAAKAFELSPGQKGDMDRILADARREVDVLRKTPDEAGLTWEAVEKDVVKMENGTLHFDGGKLAAFREKVMPGRNESFGSAMRRIREDAAKRLKETLSPAQREKWDKAQTGGLLPGTDDGGFGFMTFGAAISVPDPAAAMDDK